LIAKPIFRADLEAGDRDVGTVEKGDAAQDARKYLTLVRRSKYINLPPTAVLTLRRLSLAPDFACYYAADSLNYAEGNSL
jgi:hypothetical protein